MNEASIDGRQGHFYKPGQFLAGHLINSIPVHSYVSTKAIEADAIVKSKPAELTNQNPCHQPAQDGQIICSSLYDSFELNSFNRQLDSAIKASSRTLSMPHLPERYAQPPPVLEPVKVLTTLTKHQSMPKKVSKLSKSFKKIMKSVFGSSTNVNSGTSSPFTKETSSDKQNDSFFLYKGSKSVRVLTTIPEMQESVELGITLDAATPVVRRAASERFTAALVSVSCPSRY